MGCMNKNAILALITMLMLFLFQIGLYSAAFVGLFVQLLFVGFMQEQRRLAVWMIGAALVGMLLLQYGARFAVSLSNSKLVQWFMAEALWMIPLVFVKYVQYSFRRGKPLFWQPTMLWWLLLVTALSFFLTVGIVPDLETWLHLWFFSLVSVLPVLLWFGLLQSEWQKLLSTSFAVIWSAWAFATAYLPDGVSIAAVAIYFLVGLLYGFVTARSKRLYVAVSIQFFLTFLSFLVNQDSLVYW